jgi:hypothetical protein
LKKKNEDINNLEMTTAITQIIFVDLHGLID